MAFYFWLPAQLEPPLEPYQEQSLFCLIRKGCKVLFHGLPLQVSGTCHFFDWFMEWLFHAPFKPRRPTMSPPPKKKNPQKSHTSDRASFQHRFPSERQSCLEAEVTSRWWTCSLDLTSQPSSGILRHYFTDGKHQTGLFAVRFELSGRRLSRYCSTWSENRLQGPMLWIRGLCSLICIFVSNTYLQLWFGVNC